MALPVKPRVMAYITHGRRLLVFRQPDFPDAGVQVPGGSVNPGEPLDSAVLREAFEETGLAELKLNAYLGDVRHDLTARGRPYIQHRHYYHLTIDGEVLETWQHFETDPSEGDEERILFELFWADLPDGVPHLIADMGEMLPTLLDEIGLM
jgi:8-oxo-dGTP pyrophosphatase MutT (NUDIX family)